MTYDKEKKHEDKKISANTLFRMLILSRQIPLWLFLLGFCLYVLSMGGHGYGGVGTTTYDVTRSTRCLTAVWLSSRFPGEKRGLTGSFMRNMASGIPCIISHFICSVMGWSWPFHNSRLHYARITMFTTLLGQPFISALTWVLLFFFCRKLGYTEKTSIGCTLTYGLGTQAWMYAQLDFSEPLLTFWLLGAAYWIALPRTHPQHLRLPSSTQILLSGIFLGVAITVKIVAVLLVPVLAGYLWLIFPCSMRRKLSIVNSQCSMFNVQYSIGKALIWFLCPVLVIGGGIVGWYNFTRFGTPFETGYGNEFTTYLPDILRHFKENLVGVRGKYIFLFSGHYSGLRRNDPFLSTIYHNGDPVVWNSPDIFLFLSVYDQ